MNSSSGGGSSSESISITSRKGSSDNDKDSNAGGGDGLNQDDRVLQRFDSIIEQIIQEQKQQRQKLKELGLSSSSSPLEKLQSKQNIFSPT